ncbi:MAG: N utilization substance protein B-like protein [Candidatus Nomurabacteria bacterium GW2011_GWF2_35_66]|uniref:Transcription antitermination protein NusB n=1 Tax=Candidatus Nomurabacteria bacterium GW2011_GWE1_35_16 TaxID=1618761 RepID=A0A0G0BBN6_9BACT|nr:MAG: N utilization substance protein B-like protein [Candidatus Nomurabacteria bacterium GW2011_GWF1_34_20]KKP63552.1 MAG: N utilization substance protein B-like protein [Candidatus Nomurabacteria bacterium GW2011_GWE2_34_25]KKP66744.1 MAG: N utilization substance protein B-like protein [Candidatus Nomurabacteria bacterium GW2011_GWE1_35_16]KKP83844.1 MAG: N utilization substance protein B-like protein [Candidatus Nomurabacteria bacterium GW2011_GWF2_35_66]HAE36367.1 transcription antitermin
MANRHLSRSIVLQTLFEWDFAMEKDTTPEEMLERNIQEFGPGLDDSHFMSEIFLGIIKKKVIIDEILEKAAPDWPIDKISIVDRNILRLGLYELLFGDREQVPPKVAINEAIELAKSFGGENSSRFINGVLGGVYKELGEPGKDDVGNKKKHKHFETDPTKFPIEKKAGAVVYAIKDGQIYFAFVHDVFGYWTLSKGSIEDGENEEQGAIREIKEEMGVDIKVKELLGRSEYIATHPENGKIRKQVVFFLGETDYTDLVLEKDCGGLDDARWFPMEEVANLKIYDNMVPLLTKAVEILTKN